MRNNPNVYLLELTPVDGFFFANDRLSFDEAVTPYYTRSAYYPQQTGILGLLRHQLLLQNGLLKPGQRGITTANQSAADALIGQESFNGSTTQKFGVIESISPLLLLTGADDAPNFLHPKPETYGYTYTWEAQGRCNLGGTQQQGLPQMQGFVAKTHPFGPQWLDQQKKLWDADQLFNTQERTGIRKRRLAGDLGDKAYYRQVWLQRKLKSEDGILELKPRYAFLLQLSNEWSDYGTQNQPVVLENNMVHFGAERSLFQMSIKPATFLFEETLPDLTSLGPQALYCASDMLLTDALRKLIRFSANVSIRFNNMRSTNADVNHYIRVKLHNHWLWMLRRGAVLYSDDPDSLTTAINAQTAYFNIGYNHVFSTSTSKTPTTNE